ncbi:MAG TPA: hypothetical protein VLR26_12610 [Frankiaceae bacterium]|nr:hypothetical protein [Frankiaceae bacterium]
MASTVWLTNNLCVGDPPASISALTSVEDAEQAVTVVLRGGTALLPVGALEQGKRAMALMGASELQIERAVLFGTTGQLPPEDQGWL